MTVTSLSAAGSSSRSRQPDYFVGSSGIPRLVGLADRRVPRPCAESGRNMNRNSSLPVGTDPVKLNKCLYNLTVQKRGSTGARSGGKPESDIVIRNQYSNKSNSSTSGSNRNNNGNSTGTGFSMSSATNLASSSTVITAGLSNNRRNSVTSSHISPSSPTSSFIPRSRNVSHNLSNRNNRINGVVVHGRSQSTLLSGRQRSSTGAMGDSNRFDDDDCGNDAMRQCRFTVAVRKAPSSTADNRLNYQRKYDRTIFGYNRLEQFVLPPLQI